MHEVLSLIAESLEHMKAWEVTGHQGIGQAHGSLEMIDLMLQEERESGHGESEGLAEFELATRLVHLCVGRELAMYWQEGQRKK